MCGDSLEAMSMRSRNKDQTLLVFAVTHPPYNGANPCYVAKEPLKMECTTTQTDQTCEPLSLILFLFFPKQQRKVHLKQQKDQQKVVIK